MLVETMMGEVAKRAAWAVWVLLCCLVAEVLRDIGLAMSPRSGLARLEMQPRPAARCMEHSFQAVRHSHAQWLALVAFPQLGHVMLTHLLRNKSLFAMLWGDGKRGM